MAKTVMFEKKKLSPKLFAYKNNRFESYNISKTVVVGRKTTSNIVDIELPFEFVSRKHGQFSADENGIYYLDTNSTNGTYINGTKLFPCRKQYLHDGDIIHIYNNAPTIADKFVCMIFSTDYPVEFECESVKITHELAEINIGRCGNKKITLNNASVSANHASFFSAQSGWAVVDHNSTNGVYLNNKKLTQPQYLNFGDCVRIANTHFIFTGDAIAYQKIDYDQKSKKIKSNVIYNEPLKISIIERSVWQRTKKLMLLQDINMTINPGEMVLILGGSGAGKTTFMNAVMGYEKAEGGVMHGTTDVYEDFESVKYKIGFVPQQDLIRGSDTVYDTLENAAEMKLKANRNIRNQRIEEVLKTLGLQRERNFLVSKLSGGQRKRLSIAVEYIANPSLFFLDEPDSGLDGIMAKSLMQNLREIADEGRIVMVISHAPDRASELFDKVIVLAKSIKDNCGHLAFFGTVDEAFEFFNVNTLEDVVKRINRQDEGGEDLSDFYIEKYNQQI